MIRFGTSGWRAVIAEEFTFAGVRRVAAAIAGHLIASGRSGRGVFVGHDTRFLSDGFARAAAEEVAAHGIPVVLAPGPIPTPAVACAIVDGRHAGGINITASHNPPEYNGLKYSTADGAPARPEVTADIERRANDGPAPAGGAEGGAAARIRVRDTRAAYERRLGRHVRLRLIRRAGLRIGFDPRHGASALYLGELLRRSARQVVPIHERPDPLFGGLGPDCGEKQLAALARLVRARRLHLGVATDGDGDRFGIVDRGGRFIPANLFLAVLADYLLVERRLPGGIGRSVATTHLLDAIAALHGRRIYETPVGFKFLGEHLTAGRIFLACEESAGLSVRGHVPEKDGLLAGLLAAEMIAVRRRSLGDQIRELFRKVGPLHSRRIDYHVDAAARERLVRRLEDVPTRFAGRRVQRIDTTDGRKMILDDGSWILLRPSGTEPVVRCYAEARTPGRLRALLDASRGLVA